MLDSVKNVWLILTTAFSVICIVFIFYGVKPLVEKNLALEMTVESLDVKVNELNKNIKVLSEVRSKLVEDTSNIEARYKNADALILELKSVLKEKERKIQMLKSLTTIIALWSMLLLNGCVWTAKSQTNSCVIIDEDIVAPLPTFKAMSAEYPDLYEWGIRNAEVLDFCNARIEAIKIINDRNKELKDE